MLLLTVGLSAQRYTGHDHAVFHRAPAPPSSAAKRQPPSNPSGSKAPQKATPANTTSPSAPHAALQNHPEAELDRFVDGRHGRRKYAEPVNSSAAKSARMHAFSPRNQKFTLLSQVVLVRYNPMQEKPLEIERIEDADGVTEWYFACMVRCFWVISSAFRPWYAATKRTC